MTQLDAVFGSPGRMAIDPVCGMDVDISDPPGGTHQHEGATYYFCATGCREAFGGDPTHFLANPGHHGHDHHHQH